MSTNSHFAFLLAPADRIIVPVSHDGSAGIHRIWPRVGFHPLANDVDAVLQWASSRPSASRGHALLSLEQFLCWCIRCCDKALSSTEPADILAYDEFLQNITPATEWVASKGTRRDSPAWKPFASTSMSASTRDNALSAIRSFFDWAREQGYADLRAPTLRSKPWKGLPLPLFARHKRTGPSANVTVWIELSDMRWIWESLSHDEEKDFQARSLAFKLAYFAGLRVPDLAASRWCDLEWGMGNWFLKVERLREEVGSLLLFPPVVLSLAELCPEFARIAENPSTQDLSSLSILTNRLLPFSAPSIPTHLRKVFAAASLLAAKSGDKDAAQRLDRHKLFALRHSLAGQVTTPRQRSLVRTFVGVDVLCRGRAPRYFMAPVLARNAETTDEAVTNLRWLWHTM